MRTKSRPLVRDKDRELRLAITVEEIKILTETEKAIAQDDWEGKTHPFVERTGLQDYQVEVAIAAKILREKTAKEMERLMVALSPGDEDDE